MRINMVTDAHGVQDIIFNPLAHKGDKDFGMLYRSGWAMVCASRTGILTLQWIKSKIWASIIRIDPLPRNSVNRKYGIPPDNPFVKSGKKILPEMYADGFRNPHRITWTRSGMMLVSNIGQTNVESINLVRPGLDFDGSIREGSFVMNPYESLDDIFSAGS